MMKYAQISWISIVWLGRVALDYLEMVMVNPPSRHDCATKVETLEEMECRSHSSLVERSSDMGYCYDAGEYLRIKSG